MGETLSKTQNLPEVKAMTILDTYEGSNNYILKLKKWGELWYSQTIYHNFSKWFNEEQSVFEQLITMWVEDVLKRGVLIARRFAHPRSTKVDDVLNIGIKIS